MFRIDLAQAPGYVVDIDQDVGRVIPGVGVEAAVMVVTCLSLMVMIGIGVVMRSVILVFRFFFLHLMGLDALAGHYLDPLETGGGVGSAHSQPSGN